MFCLVQVSSLGTIRIVTGELLSRSVYMALHMEVCHVVAYMKERGNLRSCPFLYLCKCPVGPILTHTPENIEDLTAIIAVSVWLPCAAGYPVYTYYYTGNLVLCGCK